MDEGWSKEGLTWTMRLMALAGIIIVASPIPAGDADQGVCQDTARGLMSSCLKGVASDLKLALVKCDNILDEAASTACDRQAGADRRDAGQLCKAEHDVRQAACGRLGPGAYDPVINPASFSTTIDNPFFPLVPGPTFVYEGQTPDGFEHDEFAVTHNTRVISGVTCVEVHDTVMTDGVLTEDTLDWFAQDTSGNVWYFGENTHEIVDGLISTIDGTFMEGVDGAKAGIVMEAHPAIGDFYRQEFSVDNAEDFAEVIGLSDAVTVPFGSFTNCVNTRETTPLEPDLHEHKFYAAGVGNVLETDEDTGARTALIQVKTGQ